MENIENVVKDLVALEDTYERIGNHIVASLMRNTINAIRELQGNLELPENYQIGFQDGWVRALEQIPKWHYVADGDLPNELEDVLVIYEANIDGGTCDGEIIKSYGIGYLSNAKTNDWIFATYKSLKENPSVIAWMELPKFEEVE